MSIRVIVQTSLLAASLLFVACPARSTSDAGTGGGSGGGTGGGTGKTDAGVDAGMTVADAGMAPETILAAKRSMFPALVNLKNVVVTAVAFAARSTSTGADCAGSTTKGVNASYWVADSNGDHSGVFVTKYRCDPPFDYLPVIGDVLDMTGYIGLEDEFVGREQRRFIVKQQYDFIKPSPGAAGCVLPRCQPLEVTKKGTMAALPDSMVDGTFGEAGAVRANPTFAGSRVKIVADLTISAANPLALRRASMVPGDDRVSFANAMPPGWVTYEVFETQAAHAALLGDPLVFEAISKISN